QELRIGTDLDIGGVAAVAFEAPDEARRRLGQGVDPVQRRHERGDVGRIRWRHQPPDIELGDMPVHLSSPLVAASVAQQKGAAKAAPSVSDMPAGSERDPDAVAPVAAAPMLAPDEMLARAPAPAVGMHHQAPFGVIAIVMADMPALAGAI